MVVNVYYKNGNFYNTYENIERVKSYPRYHILSQSSGKSSIIENVMTFSTSDFMLEFENSCCEMSESEKMQDVTLTLNDLKNYIYDEVIIYTNPRNTCDFVNLYIGYLEDAPIDILSLPVGTIGANTKGMLDIRVGEEFEHIHLSQKEGVEPSGEINSSNNKKP